MGHHGNLLVYGPGRYKFSDLVKVGTPLPLLLSAHRGSNHAVDFGEVNRGVGELLMYVSSAVNMMLDRFATAALDFGYLPS